MVEVINIMHGIETICYMHGFEKKNNYQCQSLKLSIIETICYMHGFEKKKQLSMLCMALKQYVLYIKYKTTR